MPNKYSYLTATDQFCGAGGSTSGAKAAGVEVKMALNHWELAIETHNTNHPDTDHDCTDVQACDPRRYPSTDILITSPECTNHSLAKGRKRKFQNQMQLFGEFSIKPEEERSRATMWDVARFAEFHDYNLIIVENVVDARYWRLWNAWLKAMHDLGYNHKCCYLNSMFFHPCPQSRDRMYIVFWKKGNNSPNLEYRPMAPCPKCGEKEAYQSWKNSAKNWGKYRTQYVYRCSECFEEAMPYYYCAFNAIDWTIPGKRIGDRKKPLAKKTIERIQYGLDKYGNQSLILNLEHSKATDSSYVRPSTEAFFTQTTAQATGIAVPFIVEMNSSGKARAASSHLSTVLAGGNHHLLVGNYTPGWTRGLEKPTGTVTTQDHHALFSMPVIIENYGQSNAKPSTSPLGAVTTMIKHGIVTTDKVQAFLSYYYSGSLGASGMAEAVNTMTTTDRAGLVVSRSPSIEDCYYRMLKPHEIKAAMAFQKEYVVLGNSRQKVKQLGNAVTPPVMEWLVRQCVESIS
ncbi:MAG: DNA cytosine methyltransferase [Lewinellaceae bacterium]|nr:DNA cytosine methyltransferase [Lewinellaceae bacterium]